MKTSLKYRILLICFMIICLPIISMAAEELSLPDYTESYKRWLELSDEEKANYIEPQMYESIEKGSDYGIQSFSIDSIDEAQVGATKLPTSYKRSYYGGVKNQGNTNTCWAYSASTVFETNYYTSNSSKKEFSPLHMEYATSKTYNTAGFNRSIDSGGNMNIALAYATNGMGLVLNSAMPSTNITSSTIKNAKAASKVSDFVELGSIPDVKSYIYKYGVVSTYTNISTEYFSSNTLNYNSNLAYCCTDEDELPNHTVTLIGWDDNYTNTNFANKKGAYIALNSYGTSFGNNGLYYIFYDDCFVNNYTLYGVTKTDDIDYDYIYQYDTYGCIGQLSVSTIYATNVFTRQNTQMSEKLTEIGIYVPSKQSVTIYINANDGNVGTANATTIFTTGTLDAGYHTIKLNQPVTLSNKKFAVCVKFTDALCVEMQAGNQNSWCYTATSNAGESYVSTNDSNYMDLQELLYSEYEIKYSNACIKAFTEKGSALNMNTSVNEYTADLESYLFDYKYYADHNIDLYNTYGYNKTALQNHWNTYGKAEGRKTSPILDLGYYVSNNSDLKAAFGNNYVAAYNHFVNYGYAEYRKSSMEYDGNFYRNNNGDLKNMTSMELIRHYAVYGKNELRQANTNYDIVNYLFDASIYLKFNPDVAQAYGNNSSKLKEHWYKYGIAEGRVASLLFDARSYLRINTDVAKAYSTTNYTAAYNHFINYGFAEGRNGNVIFSVKYYIANNTDIKNAYGSNYLRALNHFALYGKNEPRLTSALFNISKYKAKNADVKAAFNENCVLYFEHYLMYGQNEKRVCV